MVLLALPALGQTGGRPPSATPTKPRGVEQPLAIAVIDIGAVLRDAVAAQNLQRQMQEQQDIYQAAFEKEQRDLRQAEDEIERQRSSLSADAYAAKRQSFQDRLTKAATDLRNRRRQLEEAFGAANAQINKTLAAVIDELATQNGIGMVLRREAVLYQKNVTDLTQPAIALLNQRLPTVSISLPPS